jgi:hypothetical protein
MRDHEEEAKVRRADQFVRNTLPPIRVTAAAIERHLGRRGWLRYRRNKLPLANAALDEAAEPVRSFQCRRLRWAVDVLVVGDEPPTVWRALKIAGLRSDWAHQASVMLSCLAISAVPRQVENLASGQNLLIDSHLDGSANDVNWDFAAMSGRVAEWSFTPEADLQVLVCPMLQTG